MVSRVRFAIVLTALIALCGCKPPPPPVHNDPVAVSKMARVKIPPSASNVFCRTDRDEQSSFSLPQLDFHYWGRFDIPAIDVPLVLDQMPKDGQTKPFSGHSNVTSHQTTDSWWHPEQLRNPQVVEWSAPGFAVNLLFGETDQPGMLTVYFFNFEM